MASRIKGLRKRAGMTQEELARRCHVTRSAVALWETERTQSLKPGHLFAAATALGVDPEFLATGKEAMATGLSEIPARARVMLESYLELPDHLQVQFGALVQSMANQARSGDIQTEMYRLDPPQKKS